MRTVHLSTGWHRNGAVTYHVHICDVTWWDHVIGKAYHWYDMRIPVRIPGWTRFEKWLGTKGAEIKIFVDSSVPVRLRDRILGWPINQDIRCYELGHAKWKPVLSLAVSAEDYLKLGGKIHPRPLRSTNSTSSSKPQV